jgi:hypothetical protein
LGELVDQVTRGLDFFGADARAGRDVTKRRTFCAEVNSAATWRNMLSEAD